MKKKDKLRIKLTAREYIRNKGNLPMALKVTNNMKELAGNGYTVQASRWKNDPLFMEQVRKELERFDKSVISDVFVLSELFDIVKDNTAKNSDKVNALGLVAKMIGATREGQQQVNVVFADYMRDLASVKVIDSINVNDKTIVSYTASANTIDVSANVV